MKITLSILATLAIITGCDSNKNNDDTDRSKFKADSMKTCIASTAGTPNAKELCECMSDDILSAFSAQELSDESNIQKIQQHTITTSAPKCAVPQQG